MPHYVSGRYMDSKANFNINPIKQINIGHPHLSWRKQHALEEGGTDQTWPNPCR